MNPPDQQTLAHRPNVPPEAPPCALSDVLAPSGQLALLGAAQLGLDGRAYAVRAEGRSPEPLLGPNTEFCTAVAPGETESAQTTEAPAGGLSQLVLDLGDLQAIPQLDMFERLDLQHAALCAELGEDGFNHRLAKCHRTRLPKNKGEGTPGYRTDRGAWVWGGLIHCDQWTCARCGPMRARSTAATLAVAIDRWLNGRRGERPSRLLWRDVWMLTLALPHRLEDFPGLTVERLYDAHARFIRSSAWRAFCREWGIKSHVRVLDNAHGGKNGTHPHFHIALFPSRARDVGSKTFWESHRGKSAEERAQRCDEIASALWGAWHDALRAAGVERMITGEALKLSPAEKAAAYFTGWGLGDEVGASTQKVRSHLRLLDAAGAGVAGAGAGWIQWVAATHGRQWVTGLGDLAARMQITDDDIEQHVAALRAARDAAAAARGEPVVLVKPLQVCIPDGLYAASRSLGWRRVNAICDAADVAGLPPQLALVDALCEERRRLELRDLRRRGRAPP